MSARVRNRARRHHVVPRFYLARFAGAEGDITVHDKSTGADEDQSPKAASVEVDFYTIDIGAGPSDEIEQRLSEIESKTAEALRRIDAGTFPPSDEDRGVIASFMALQFVRGPQFRSMNDSAATQMMQLASRVMASDPEYVRKRFRQIEGRDPPMRSSARW